MMSADVMSAERIGRLALLWIAAVALLWTGVGCATPSFNDLSTWRGCLIQPSLSEDPSDNGPLAGGDAEQTVYISWQGKANEYASLRVALPGSLPRKKAVEVANDEESFMEARYQQGTTMQEYDSRTVKGQVTVQDFDDRKATMDVDLTVSEPNLDVNLVGAVPLKGRLELQRVRSVKECY